MKKTTALVTGGAGFIGSHLCSELLRHGKRVISVDSFCDFYDPEIKRANIRAVESEDANGAFVSVEGDIRDTGLLDEVFDKYCPDLVYHIAAYAGVRPSIENPALYYSVNVDGTLSVLECMRRHGVRDLVFASSSSVYGNNRKLPFSEVDSVDNPISPYAATKKAGELLCHTYHHLHGISVACLRFFTVYGPRQRPDLAIHKFARLMLEGKEIPFFGDGSTERDYTYIDDIIKGVIGAAEWISGEKPAYGIFNLGESRTISLDMMVATLERALNVKAVLRHLDMQPGDVLRTYADISKARAELGYAPCVDFEEGISRFAEWCAR